MPAIPDTTRARITAHLEVFVENLVRDYRDRIVSLFSSPQAYLRKKDSGGGLKPFHAALVPREVLRISQFERGLVTRLGSSLEECAVLIAAQHHPVAKRGFTVQGELTRDASAEIARLLNSFEHMDRLGTNRLSLEEMIDAVLRACQTGRGDRRSRKADLYVRTSAGDELLFEMKSPKPNKDQCLRITEGILLTHALLRRRHPQAQAYLALPYNPFGNSRSDYNWSYPKNYMPFEDAVLIGDEFWSLLGGPGTYEELLEIYQYVGRVKGKYVADALAFGN